MESHHQACQDCEHDHNNGNHNHNHMARRPTVDAHLTRSRPASTARPALRGSPHPIAFCHACQTPTAVRLVPASPGAHEAEAEPTCAACGSEFIEALEDAVDDHIVSSDEAARALLDSVGVHVPTAEAEARFQQAVASDYAPLMVTATVPVAARVDLGNGVTHGVTMLTRQTVPLTFNGHPIMVATAADLDGAPTPGAAVRLETLLENQVRGRRRRRTTTVPSVNGAAMLAGLFSGMMGDGGEESIEEIASLLFAQGGNQDAGAPPLDDARRARLQRTRWGDLPQDGRPDWCAICQDPDVDPEAEAIALPCSPSHAFHADCILPWLEMHNSCPCCRQPVNGSDSEAGGDGASPRPLRLNGHLMDDLD